MIAISTHQKTWHPRGFRGNPNVLKLLDEGVDLLLVVGDLVASLDGGRRLPEFVNGSVVVAKKQRLGLRQLVLAHIEAALGAGSERPELLIAAVGADGEGHVGSDASEEPSPSFCL